MGCSSDHTPFLSPPPHSSKHEDDWLRRRNIGVAVVVAFLLPTLFPIGHILIFSFLWDKGDHVDTDTCTNSCWDTVFKGPYEGGTGRYKHVYFNATANATKMWVITVLAIVIFYETFKYLTLLTLKGRLRRSMGLLVLSSLHSHYYAWWMHWNYWNDDFYFMLAHQIFFSVTEIASTIAVLANVDSRVPLKPLPLIFVANVALFHVFTSSLDQFVSNILSLNGRPHQVYRDILLMSTDLIQVCVPLYVLHRAADERGSSVRLLLRQKSHLWSIGITTALMFLYVAIFP